MTNLSPDIDPGINAELHRSGSPDRMKDNGFPIPEEVIPDEDIEFSNETLEEEINRILRMMRETGFLSVKQAGDPEPEMSDEEFQQAERWNMTPAMIRHRNHGN